MPVASIVLGGGPQKVPAHAKSARIKPKTNRLDPSLVMANLSWSGRGCRKAAAAQIQLRTGGPEAQELMAGRAADVQWAPTHSKRQGAAGASTRNRGGQTASADLNDVADKEYANAMSGKTMSANVLRTRW